MSETAAPATTATTAPPAMTERLTLAVFGFSLFLSALIMFALEPMTGKMLLPLVGGTPAGWVVAMAFFQIMLLLGYLVAHLFSRYSPRNHALLYIALLAAGFIFLPPHLASTGTEGTPGPVDIFLLLCRTIALPFIALSAGSSTLQRLFTTVRHRAAGDPYFLYAASNLGSFAGLLLYPLAIEPFAGLLRQSHQWAWGYGALMALAVLCLSLADKTAAAEQPREAAPDAAIPARLKIRWLLLAFVPSSLMLGVTTQITADIFSAPMLWVLPLALYLLTFVIAFSRKPVIPYTLARVTQHLFVTVAVSLLIIQFLGFSMSWVLAGVHLLCFTAVALACHMQLATLRPADSKRHLTSFYLMMALGGALGGVLNAFVVPLVLNRLLEYPAMLTLSLLLNPLFYKKFDKVERIFFCIALACAAFYCAAITDTITLPAAFSNSFLLIAVLIVYFSMTGINVRTTFFGTALLLLVFEFVVPQSILSIERNFYGVVKVFEHNITIDGHTYRARYMAHGSTIHGVEIMDAKFRDHPMAYYGPDSGIGRLFSLYKPKDILVVGLGTGQLTCYSRPDTAMTAIDIDPAVIAVAQNQFTYLKDCHGRQPLDIIQGDGRLEIEKMGNRKFDLIVLDAFTGDGIPEHLMTMEALLDDMQHLKPGGMIAANISNRYFNLAPVLSATAHVLGMQAIMGLHTTENISYDFPSAWVVMAPKGTDLSKLDHDKKADSRIWLRLPPNPEQRVWTDDYSSLLDALNVSIPFIHKHKTLDSRFLP